jgi:hypothetical protein
MTDWLLSIAWYGSVIAALAGSLAIVRPMRRIGLATRSHGAVLLAIALLMLTMNALMSPPVSRQTEAVTAIDRIMPVFHFREAHARTIAAPPARVLPAIHAVTASEIALFQTFTAIRRFGRAGPESILNAPAGEPLLSVATRSGFHLLAQTDDEIVIGAIVAAPRDRRLAVDRTDPDWFVKLSTPGVVKAVMNFRAAAAPSNGTQLTTETRVFATDSAGLRRFTPYWRTIFPGSWILRVSWLGAIARRAER